MLKSISEWVILQMPLTLPQFGTTYPYPRQKPLSVSYHQEKVLAYECNDSLRFHQVRCLPGSILSYREMTLTTKRCSLLVLLLKAFTCLGKSITIKLTFTINVNPLISRIGISSGGT